MTFPFSDGRGSKIRPALVVQDDRNNTRLRNTIVAMISGNTRLAGKEPTQFPIDPVTPDGETSGLLGPSAVVREHLHDRPGSDSAHARVPDAEPDEEHRRVPALRVRIVAR